MISLLDRLRERSVSVDLSGFSSETREAVVRLGRALEDAAALPSSEAKEKEAKNRQSSEDESSSVVSMEWLLDLCRQVPSELEPERMSRAIIDASKLTGEDQQQAALFDALGASDQAMTVLFTIAPLLPDIQSQLGSINLAASGAAFGSTDAPATRTVIDLQADHRQLLLQEAMDAQQVASIAQAELEVVAGPSNHSTTHTVTRQSEVQARKVVEKARRRAQQAFARAKEAGVVLDENDLLPVPQNVMGQGGLVNLSEQDLRAIQVSLLPEGSRQYYDESGLPRGAIRESMDDFDRVIIPPPQRDKSTLHEQLQIMDSIHGDAAKAFKVKSLNPMQSTVFEVAYRKRENLLVCAPTGAGKTNVAMLTVVSHLRDVGLIDPGSVDPMETGKKVVYVAPMKALAQEVVEKFSTALKPLGLIVRELTGDMQLTRAEAESANVLVTTPEKWDVVTRKAGTDDKALGNQCGLLIIDEIHLLADERGAVIESVVARLHRLVESRQRQIRIVGLSATLPNYEDVANFLRVSDRGLFFFGPEHRPVPLEQTFYGINVPARDRQARERKLNEICFDVVVDSLQRGYQVMVFVHSRKGTGDTASALAELATQAGLLDKLFVTQGKEDASGDANKRYADRVKKSRNREVGIHFERGMGIHHAGMLRGDRNLVERMFADGAIKVLCCTATLAWGINLPAHSVIIKGTDVYNPEKGGTADLSILDVQQIFGRAGRPQFDSFGEATLITTHEAFKRYLDKLVRAVPIESNFTKQLADHLSAEVVGGTVTNVREAATWLTYTYLYTRMIRNPLAYGINGDQKTDDPMLRSVCAELVTNAAKFLDSNQMARFDPVSGNISTTSRGRVAAHFYVQAESIGTFRDMLDRTDAPTDGDLCRVICAATEFHQLKVRQEELDELQRLVAKVCPLKIKGAGLDDAGNGLVVSAVDKAFVLMQAYISRAKINSFTLISDMNYIAANTGRVARAIFEICLQDKRAGPAAKLLRIAKSVDQRNWWFQSPLRIFGDELRESVYTNLERNREKAYDSLDSALRLLEMQPGEVGQFCRWHKGGEKIHRFVRYLPVLSFTCDVRPVSSSVFNFRITVSPEFVWHGRWHGTGQYFWLWIEDSDNNRIHHHEQISFSKRTFPEPLHLDISLPVFDPLPSQYFIRCCSDSWVGVEILQPVPFDGIRVPNEKTQFTELLDLTPLPTTALQEPKYEQLYDKICTFNPIQTQLFHVLYHTSVSVLLGAPTGSGKTMVAELAILRMKRLHPKGICVYIAPLKSLARERLTEWSRRFGSSPLSWKVLELSGDTSHDQNIIERADILVCTPEKWDLVSRGWRGDTSDDNGSTKRAFPVDDSRGSNRGRSFVKRVKLLVLDEVHLLGEERGAVLEAIVSRTRFISQLESTATRDQDSDADHGTRIMGLSTAVANPLDLAEWIGIDVSSYGPSSMRGMYNFKHSVRPVPLKIHIQGFPGKHYCPRMATMNKPCFAAIKEHSATKPSLIFVASRRQTRLTALELINYAAGEEDPKRFLHADETYVEGVASKLNDEALRHSIQFGIGLHHAGLSTSDRDVVERLYLDGSIQVLVATATLAWGVNLPAHLVIVKGTEYFDGKSSRYVDYPLTDVLQMIGRAGRPGFDSEGHAVVMSAEDKKAFYKKFLFTSFPVESCLESRLEENLCAEISSGTISSTAEAVGYLNWTFFARRVRRNPSYYGLESDDEDTVQCHFLETVKRALLTLQENACIVEGNGDKISASTLGRACSNYYLDHRTPKQLWFGASNGLKILSSLDSKARAGDLVVGHARPFRGSAMVNNKTMVWLLYSIASTHEFDELPVRHNEEYLNEELASDLPWGADAEAVVFGKNEDRYISPEVYADPHTKCFLLLQAHLERSKLPISDYINDSKTVVEQVPRLLAAMEFIAQHECQGAKSFNLMVQFVQIRQLFESQTSATRDPLVQLPGVTTDSLREGKEMTVAISELRSLPHKDVSNALRSILRPKARVSVDHIMNVLRTIPAVEVSEAQVFHRVRKKSNTSIGILKISLNISRGRASGGGRGKSDGGISAEIIVGTFTQRFFLARSTVRMSKTGTWKVTRNIEFEWDAANADGGEDGGKLLVCLMLDSVRGFDQEIVVPLR